MSYAGSRSNSCTPPLATLPVTARKLAPTAVCGSTKRAYAYLHHIGMAITSVQSALSAINNIHKRMGCADVFQNFWVARMMLGFKKSHIPVPDSGNPSPHPVLVSSVQLWT